MKITAAGIKLIKDHEGCKLQAYPDPASGGDPWTIGFGSTGSYVKKGTVWTMEQATDMLTKDLIELAAKLTKVLPVATTDNQFNAILSLVYNIGIGNFIGHDLLKFMQAGDLEAAANEFPKWDKAAGKVMPGLVARRQAEKELFES